MYGPSHQPAGAPTRLPAGLGCGPIAVVLLAAGVCGAQASAPPQASATTGAQASSSPAAQQSAAGLAGVVVDPSGAAVVHAEVTAVEQGGGSGSRSAATDGHGEYSFEHLAAGVYRVVVTAAGFATESSEPVEVGAQGLVAMPRIVLSLASASATVQVNAHGPEVAEQQMKAAEKQRVLGLAPNFYTAYQFDAEPLTTRQKYTLALRNTLDPFRFVGTAAGAGIEQATNAYAGYGQGAAGYGKRYAALYGNGLFGDLFSHAVYPSLLHQDPRYFYQGTGSVRSRFVHAISFAVVTRGDRGQLEPNYSPLLGDLTAGALANAYYPHANRGVRLVFVNSAIGIGGRAAGTLLREFVLPGLTRNKAGNGMP